MSKQCMVVAVMGFIVGAALTSSSAHAQVSCGDTVTDDVTLEGDLDCPGAGLIVGADDVVIDLNGFTIQGNTIVHDGVRVTGFDGVTIKDGTIAGFDACVTIAGNAQQARISDLVLVGCNFGGLHLDGADFARVKRVVSMGHQNIGFFIDEGATGNRVERSAAIGNDNAGLQVSGDGNVLKRIDLAANGDGIRIFGGDNLIDRCTSHASSNYGLRIFDDGNRVRRCEITGNPLNGILVTGADDVTIERSRAHGNGQGITVADDSDRVELHKNEVVANALGGMHVEADCDAAVLERNESIANRGDGIRSDNASALIKRNEGRRNLGHGITAPNGAVDGSGNEASENADPLQCEGVDCRE